MARIKLTDRFIQSCTSPVGKRLEIADALCPGLYLRVCSPKSKSFSVLVRHGQLVRRTLGSYPILTLSEARRMALQTMRELAEHGVAVKPETRSKTLLELIESYTALHLQPNLRSWRFVQAKLKSPSLKHLHTHPASSVTRAEIVAVMDQLVANGTPHAAENLLKAMRAMFNWAVARGELASNPLLGLKSPARHVQRDRVLTDAEIVSIWQACDLVPEPFGAMVQLLILTGARRSEVGACAFTGEPAGHARMPPGLRFRPTELAKRGFTVLAAVRYEAEPVQFLKFRCPSKLFEHADRAVMPKFLFLVIFVSGNKAVQSLFHEMIQCD